MAKTIAEINEKIKKGQAVVATAEEIIEIARKKGVTRAAQDVDVVTTGTFGPMCGSGAYFNMGHTTPRMKLGGGKLYLNDVPAYTGMAAVDFFLGATALPDDDPKNRIRPGEFLYGGGHVIEELVAGKDIRLIASAYGTDCYPRRKLETWININDFNEAVLFNIRNAYQNAGNINYATSGQLSPLLNDPYYKTIGIGTRIFLGGGVGYVSWHGTQHNPHVPRGENGVPKQGAGALAVIGDLKQMRPEWLVGTSFLGYGCTLTVGVGVPIPILSEEILQYTTVTDAEIYGSIIDYSSDYPERKPNILAEVSYAELRSGKVVFNGKEVPTASLSSYPGAREIADILKKWIRTGDFLLTEAVMPLPGLDSDVGVKPFEERPLQ
jgi:uncharacterized protein (DUF39 family)